LVNLKKNQICRTNNTSLHRVQSYIMHIWDAASRSEAAGWPSSLAGHPLVI